MFTFPFSSRMDIQPFEQQCLEVKGKSLEKLSCGLFFLHLTVKAKGSGNCQQHVFFEITI